MLALMLLCAAQAAELRAHMAALAGPYGLPLHAGTGRALCSRIEVGAGSPGLQGFALAQFATVPALDWWEVDEAETAFVGHVFVTQLGVGARTPWMPGLVGVTPHVTLGVASLDSPVKRSNKVYRDDIASNGTTFTAGPHAVAPFAQAGADLTWAIAPDAVRLLVGPDVGWIFAEGVGLSVAVRMGAAARF